MLRNELRTIAAAMLLLAAPAEAVEFGWQELPEGGIEYLVQVEPELVDSFEASGFASEIPPGLRDVRRIRITVGTGELPNQGKLTRPEPQQPDREPPPAATFGEPPDGQTAREPTAVEQAPPLLEPEHPASSLPFFRPGKSRTFDKGNAPEPRQPTVEPAKDDAAEASSPPRLIREDVENARLVSMADGAVDVAKPATAPAAEPGAEIDRPWGTLMLVLMGLYVSVGINLYLVWIHQGTRIKYRTLLRQNPQGS